MRCGPSLVVTPDARPLFAAVIVTTKTTVCLLAVLATGATLALSHPAAASPNVYVTHQLNPSVTRFHSDVTGDLVGIGAVPMSSEPEGVAVAPSGKYLYVAIQGAGTVDRYGLDEFGDLTATPPASVAIGGAPEGLAISPNGQHLYVTSSVDGTISQFSVGTDGGLTAKQPAQIALAGLPQGLAITPDGKTVYVANQGDGKLWRYSVGADGTLAGATAAAGTGVEPEGVAVSPDGKSVYVTDASEGTVRQWSIGANGQLSPKAPAAVIIGGTPEGIAMSTSGRNVYIVDSFGSGSVSQYKLDAAGRLGTRVSQDLAGDEPAGVAVGLPAPPAAGHQYVALGDSFSSGEGLREFVGPYQDGTDEPGVNRCHRSDGAYGWVLSHDGTLLNLRDITFRACSGAVSADFVEPNPMHKGEDPQLDYLGIQTSWVTLTIGGNDVGFEQIMRSCIYDTKSPHELRGRPDCSSTTTTTGQALRTDTLERVLEVTSTDRTPDPTPAVHPQTPDDPDTTTVDESRTIYRLYDLLMEIRARAKHASIFVADYPLLFGPPSATKDPYCKVRSLPPDVRIHDNDIQWLREMQRDANRRIKQAVLDAAADGVRVTFVPASPRFHQHGLCDTSDSWINQVLGEFPGPNGTWYGVAPESLHPTLVGQRTGFVEAFKLAGAGK